MSAREPAGPRDGAIDAAVADELPGLRLAWLTAPARAVASPPAVVARLRALSDRARGATVVAMRTHPIPRAYRTCYRQIGLDPDVERIPSEAAATARLLHGAFRSRDLISDACLIAVVETGVPVWALDAAVVDAAGPGLRITLAAAAIASSPAGTSPAAAAAPPPTAASTAAPSPAGVLPAVAPGSLVVADARRVHAALFGTPLAPSAPGASTTEVALYAVGVAGVPAIHVHEALWLAAESLGAREGC